MSNTKARRSKPPNLLAQRPGRVIKLPRNHTESLSYRTVLTCEPCQVSCSDCGCLTHHLHSSDHLDLFAKDRFQLCEHLENLAIVPTTSRGTSTVRSTSGR